MGRAASTADGKAARFSGMVLAFFEPQSRASRLFKAAGAC